MKFVKKHVRTRRMRCHIGAGRSTRLLRAMTAGFVILMFLDYCDTRHQPADSLSVIPFLKSPRPVFPNDSSAICDSILLEQFGFTGQGRECGRTLNDSLFYTYWNEKGDAVVSGKRVRMNVERISTVLDSLRAIISSNFGRSMNCKNIDRNDPYFARLDIWHFDNRTIFLKPSEVIAPASMSPGVTIEIDEGVRTCKMMLGGPQPRL